MENSHDVRMGNSRAVDARIVLAIGNIYEFNEKHNSGLSVSSLVDKRIKKPNFAVSSEMALFWGAAFDRRVVIVPAAPHSAIVDYVSGRLGVNFTCIIPECITGWVCRDLLADQHALNSLLQVLGDADVVVIPWGVTDYMYQLVGVLKTHGVHIVEERYPPMPACRVAEYIDSKLGGRSVLDRVSHEFPQFTVPQGYICANRDEAALLAYTLLKQDAQPLVLKSNRGAGGRGIRIVTPTSTPGFASHTLESIEHEMSDDQYWKDVPIIVEAAIGGATNLTVPTFNGCVESDGSVTSTPLGSSLVEAHQYYRGVELGKGVLQPTTYVRLEQIGIAVGKRLATLGYCGWYDVDFLAPDSSDQIYGSEINARLTGPAFAIDAMSRMYGPSWHEYYYCRVQERVWLARPMHSLTELARVLTTIDARWSTDECGILPVFTSGVMLTEPYIGYLIYGRHRQQVDILDEEIRELLQVATPTISSD